MILERLWRRKGGHGGVVEKAQAVLDHAGPGGQLPQKEYKEYAGAEADAAADDLGHFVDVPKAALKEACGKAAREFANDLLTTQMLDDLGRNFEATSRRQWPITGLLEMVGATRADAHAALLRDMMPRLQAHLINDWKGLGLDGRDMAEVVFRRADEQFRAMNTDEIVALLKKYGLSTRIGFDIKQLGLASADPAGELAQVYGDEKPADERRGSAALVAVIGMMLLDKITMMHTIASQHVKRAPLLQPLEKREDLLPFTELLRKRYKASAVVENGADKALVGYANVMFEAASRLRAVHGRLVK